MPQRKQMGSPCAEGSLRSVRCSHRGHRSSWPADGFWAIFCLPNVSADDHHVGTERESGMSSDFGLTGEHVFV
jgi:hypothetical protein